ncbi:MAG TPA: helix-turn-helix domain-containing protein [Acidimicrobiales bacterium]|nr:helix-turn-helix domain-containing protein [Acidimicrobiales bacterium]
MSTKQRPAASPPPVAEVERLADPDAGDAATRGEVNLKTAALVLGVHYMTAYRYVRQGRLQAYRDGTEWRVPRGALAAFKLIKSESPDSGVIGTPEAHWVERLESCLLSADETSSWKIIESALAAGRTSTYCYIDMIAASLASIGERWATGEIGVADQYLATAVAVRLVSRLGARFRRPGRSRGTVVFGAPSGELHALPIAIASDLVRLRGYDVLELGANVPVEAFVASALQTPRLICVGIGVTRSELLDSAQAVVDAIRLEDANLPIVIGGLVVTELDKLRLRGVSAIASDGLQAIEIIESFAASRAMRQVV